MTAALHRLAPAPNLVDPVHRAWVDAIGSVAPDARAAGDAKRAAAVASRPGDDASHPLGRARDALPATAGDRS